MKRKALSRIRDVFGDWFDVSSFRATVHGFDVVLGWPSKKKRGPGGAGRPGVILTKPLVEHMEKFRMNPGKANLPLGPSAIRRIRERLGHHIRVDIRRWWEQRRKDLAWLSGFKFSAKHGKSPQAARYTVRILFGPRHKPHLWWTAPGVVATLSSNRSDTEVAVALGISPNSVRRIRYHCRQTGLGSFPLRYRPRFWWEKPEVQKVLRSGKKYREMAATLGIGMSVLKGIITQSRQAGLGPPQRHRKRRR